MASIDDELDALEREYEEKKEDLTDVVLGKRIPIADDLNVYQHGSSHKINTSDQKTCASGNKTQDLDGDQEKYGSAVTRLSKIEDDEDTFDHDDRRDALNEKGDIDYRVYYEGIDEEFKKTDDCNFSILEVKEGDATYTELIQKMHTKLKEMSDLCLKEGPNQICQRQANATWMKLRRERITASMAQRVFRRKKLDPVDTQLKFVQGLLNPYRYQGGIESTIHGKEGEKFAIGKYKRSRPNMEVRDTGMWVNSANPWLGASPDGIVLDKTNGEEGLLEVKCPSRGKGSSFADIASQKGFYMIKGEDGEYYLDPKTEYYFQVQICLLVLDKQWCDFVISTDKDIYIHRITKNESFGANTVPKLSEFFHRYILPVSAWPPQLKGRSFQYKAVSRETWQKEFGGQPLDETPKKKKATTEKKKKEKSTNQKSKKEKSTKDICQPSGQRTLEESLAQTKTASEEQKSGD